MCCGSFEVVISMLVEETSFLLYSQQLKCRNYAHEVNIETLSVDVFGADYTGNRESVTCILVFEAYPMSFFIFIVVYW